MYMLALYWCDNSTPIKFTYYVSTTSLRRISMLRSYNGKQNDRSESLGQLNDLWRSIFKTLVTALAHCVPNAIFWIINAASHIKLKKIATDLKNPLFLLLLSLRDENFPFFVDQKSAKKPLFFSLLNTITPILSTTHYKIGKIKSNFSLNSGIKPTVP